MLILPAFQCNVIISPYRYKVMRSCWNFTPDERPSFTALVEDINELHQLEVKDTSQM